MKKVRHFNRWEQVFAWLPVEVLGKDRTTTVWLEKYWRCRRRFGPFEYEVFSLEMPRPDASGCEAHMATGIAVDPCCPTCDFPGQPVAGEAA